jgi:hypothetical protein
MKLPKWLTRWFVRDEAVVIPAVVDAESAKQAAVISIYGMLDKAMDVVEFLDRTLKTELKESPRNPACVFAAMLQTAAWIPDNAKKLAEEWSKLSPGNAAFEVAVFAVGQVSQRFSRSQVEAAVQLGYQAYKLLASFRNGK